MSLNIVEQLGSRQISRTDGKLSARRGFHVWNSTSPLTTPGQVYALSGTGGLPYFTEPFPESPNLIARDYNISRVDGHRDLWLVEWDYQPGDSLTSSQKDPTEIGYVEISARLSASFVEAWRSLQPQAFAALMLSVYPNGSNNSSRPNIGGAPIDVAGEPMQDVVRQVEIQVSETLGGIPNISAMLPFVWRRNNTPFLGAPVGQLLYVGANVNRIDVDRFRFEHTFVLDRWWHMRQQPYKFPDGRIPLMGVPGKQHAESVFLVQPFEGYANFFALSPNFSAVQNPPLVSLPFP